MTKVGDGCLTVTNVDLGCLTKQLVTVVDEPGHVPGGVADFASIFKCR